MALFPANQLAGMGPSWSSVTLPLVAVWMIGPFILLPPIVDFVRLRSASCTTPPYIMTAHFLLFASSLFANKTWAVCALGNWTLSYGQPFSFLAIFCHTFRPTHQGSITPFVCSFFIDVLITQPFLRAISFQFGWDMSPYWHATWQPLWVLFWYWIWIHNVHFLFILYRLSHYFLFPLGLEHLPWPIPPWKRFDGKLCHSSANISMAIRLCLWTADTYLWQIYWRFSCVSFLSHCWRRNDSCLLYTTLLMHSGLTNTFKTIKAIMRLSCWWCLLQTPALPCQPVCDSLMVALHGPLFSFGNYLPGTTHISHLSFSQCLFEM